MGTGTGRLLGGPHLSLYVTASGYGYTYATASCVPHSVKAKEGVEKNNGEMDVKGRQAKGDLE